MRSHLTNNVIRKKYLTTAVQVGLIMGMSHAAYAVETTNNTENDEAATPSATLDAITVYSDGYRSTGTKTALDPNDAPMSYTRIDQDLLQKRQADSVNAALRYEPGVSSESRGTVCIGFICVKASDICSFAAKSISITSTSSISSTSIPFEANKISALRGLGAVRVIYSFFIANSL